MTSLEVKYADWMEGALCTNSDVNFFPEKGQTAAAARAVCRECPVRLACLQWAVDTRAEHGVFGGTSARDRRWLQPQTAAWQCSDCLRAFATKTGLTTHRRRYCGVPETHGTHGAYGKGCRCGPCKSAHAAYMRKQRRRRLKAVA